MPCFVVETVETYEHGSRAPFVKWLESQGFKGRTLGGHLGGGTCKPWLFIDIDGCEFVYGVWGAQATGPVIDNRGIQIYLCNHSEKPSSHEGNAIMADAYRSEERRLRTPL